MEITNNPLEEDINKVSESVRDHNFDFMEDDFCKLSVFERDTNGNVIAGLIATTYWERLDIKYLWVSPEYRGKGLSIKLLLSAENEAVDRGCKFSQVDTFDFQALGLYLKLDYIVFGELKGFKNDHKRYYLQKPLAKI